MPKLLFFTKAESDTTTRAEHRRRRGGDDARTTSVTISAVASEATASWTLRPLARRPAGADCGSPERDDARGARDARDLAVGLSDVVAAAPVRSVHQAISCRPEDVRKPARGNSVHRGFAGNADGTTHHGGSHHGYMAFKIQKLAEQNEVVAGRATRGEHDPASSNASNASGGVFHGVCIHVNGITDPPWMDLKDIMLANGGRFANYYSRVAVTHVVCAGLTAAKLAALKKADRNHPPVVHPAWVTQSLKAGKLLPCASFALEGTLEPGQRRIAAFAANLALKNAGARFENDGGDDDDGGTPRSIPISRTRSRTRSWRPRSGNATFGRTPTSLPRQSVANTCSARRRRAKSRRARTRTRKERRVPSRRVLRRPRQPRGALRRRRRARFRAVRGDARCFRRRTPRSPDGRRGIAEHRSRERVGGAGGAFRFGDGGKRVKKTHLDAEAAARGGAARRA